MWLSRSRNVWVFTLILALTGCDTSSSTGADSGPRFEVSRMEQAYNLLAQNDKALVDRRIWRIVPTDGADGFVVHDCNRGVFHVGYQSVGPVWDAGVLVHEAIHVQECHQGCINRQERIAIREQVRVLRYLGAPRHWIDWALTQRESHCNGLRTT